MREFNVTGLCVQKKHYMVDINNKLVKIKELIDRGKYFTINKARQFGKTTTLSLIKRKIEGEYICIKISFEGLGDESFSTAEIFCSTFVEIAGYALELVLVDDVLIKEWNSCKPTNFKQLSNHITKMCNPNKLGNEKVLLMIDEVDKTSNNQIFLDFLGMLRDKYLLREEGYDYTFHSVILVGVNDIKNIKLSMIQKGVYQMQNNERIYNSPWNIATDFDVDMSFNPDEIATMLVEYEKDHHTEMNIKDISDKIYSYTNGYPYLVSRLCKHIDEKLNKDWSTDGVQEAVKIILKEQNTLFDDLFKNIESNEKLYNLIYDILIVGTSRVYQIDSPTVSLANMYGIIMDKDNKIFISNKIFEIRIYNYFITKDEESNSKKVRGVLQSDIIVDGRFNMVLCLEKFAKHYAETFAYDDVKFLEQNARQVFLTYLKPLINGQGFYHIESQLLDQRRMDIVVDFGKEQFILELKLWYGDNKHKEAYNQLVGYLNSKNTTKGYLLTFDFRKKQNKEHKAEWIKIHNKQIFDVIV